VKFGSGKRLRLGKDLWVVTMVRGGIKRVKTATENLKNVQGWWQGETVGGIIGPKKVGDDAGA